MKISPKDRNTGVEFIESLSGQNVDRNFVPSVEKGVMSACTEGVIAGYKIVDVLIDFYDGKMHPVDSKDIAFQIAGKSAFKEAFLKAKPRLLEPIFDIEVRAPEDCLGSIMGDLSSRRGRITGTDGADGYSVVKAQVPQKELYKYASVLRSLTGGRGIHTEQFSHYTEMPREQEQAIIAEHGKKQVPEE
jgi:elongation factor G